MASWSEQEFATANLGDKRLNQRLEKVASTLTKQPGKSLPAACGSWSDLWVMGWL